MAPSMRRSATLPSSLSPLTIIDPEHPNSYKAPPSRASTFPHTQIEITRDEYSFVGRLKPTSPLPKDVNWPVYSPIGTPAELSDGLGYPHSPCATTLDGTSQSNQDLYYTGVSGQQRKEAKDDDSFAGPATPSTRPDSVKSDEHADEGLPEPGEKVPLTVWGTPMAPGDDVTTPSSPAERLSLQHDTEAEAAAAGKMKKMRQELALRVAIPNGGFSGRMSPTEAKVGSALSPLTASLAAFVRKDKAFKGKPNGT